MCTSCLGHVVVHACNGRGRSNCGPLHTECGTGVRKRTNTSRKGKQHEDCQLNRTPQNLKGANSQPNCGQGTTCAQNARHLCNLTTQSKTRLLVDLYYTDAGLERHNVDISMRFQNCYETEVHPCAAFRDGSKHAQTASTNGLRHEHGQNSLPAPTAQRTFLPRSVLQRTTRSIIEKALKDFVPAPPSNRTEHQRNCHMSWGKAPAPVGRSSTAGWSLALEVLDKQPRSTPWG
eukprot:5625993-Amphidinium_carterae.1